jgi:hypothetical protein
MTRLERHARWMLRFYPAAYRRERGEEMIGTLLEASAGLVQPGQIARRRRHARRRNDGLPRRATVDCGLRRQLCAAVTADWNVPRPLIVRQPEVGVPQAERC